MSLLLCLLILLTASLKQLTVSKKGLVGDLGLVLEPEPVPCLMVSHCMLQDYDFEHFYGLVVSEFT